MEKNCLVSGTLLKGAAYTYKIERVLGQGSFGITYLATTDVKLEGALGTFSSRLRVAVKEFFMRDINGRHDQTVTCGTQGGLYEHYRHKFAREAQNLSKLHHPHIVRVLEAFETNNTVYYAMEFCEEGSLDELIGREGLAEGQALTFARQIGSALDYMHGERVLHLDLKPGNVMLRGKDEATLIDFGLSKQYDETGEPESSTTIGGGTPGYAPLEQSNYREGREFPVQMDVYALGATLFKMLTGERPAEAAVLLNEGFPTEKLTAQGVSEQTIAVVEKAMSPMKRDRYGSVAEFLAALDGVANEQPSAPAPEERTVYTDPAVEATVLDEMPKPTPNAEPTLAPASESTSAPESTPESTRQTPPAPTPPKKKSGKKVLWTVLILLLVAGCLWGGRTVMTLLGEQQTIADSIALAEAERAAFVQDSTEKANAAAEKAEKDRLAKEKAEKEKAEQERLAEEKAAEEKAAKEAAEKAERERLAREEAARQAAARASRGSINGHEWVDLGLSVKWATCNVGASSPSEYGNYYAWGETRTKSEYYTSNSATYKKSMGDIAGNPNYDAARANWGGSWRLPTNAEFQELIDKCTWTWTSQGGHKGYKVTGKNGNSIFLPAAGWRGGSSLNYAGEDGYYWSSSPDESGLQRAYGLNFGSGYRSVSWYGRYGGRPVRPVSE